MFTKKRVCVIGAGVSGLAAAKAFSGRGHDVEIIERSHEIGGVWAPSRSYPDVRTQSPKDLYRYTDLAMPRDFPEWPKGPQVHAYLSDYARRHDLHAKIRFGVIVETAERVGGGRGWHLGLKLADGAQVVETFDFIAVCTGQFSEKRIITHPGQNTFVTNGGAVLHSSDYVDPESVAGKRVVVLGASKSATDIAVNAVRSGATAVTLVYREAMWRIPYFIGGLVNFKRILYVRAQEQMFPSWKLDTKSRVMHALAKPFVWANWRALEALLKMQLKLAICDMVPSQRIEDTVNCSTPIATPDFYPMVADGRIVAIRGTFDHYDPGAIIMSGGQRVDADVAILAVGWKLGVPFLSEADLKTLIEPDGQYRLYRVIVNPDLPGLGFVGFNSSFCTLLTAEIAANWLVRYADQQLARQPSVEDMRRDIDLMLSWRRVERPAAGVYGGLCVAPYHFKHLDELISDMGATIKSRNPLAERFLPPNADAYARYLASTPNYRVA